MRFKYFSYAIPLMCLLFYATNAFGNWAKTYGGINDEKASAIQQTSDGGYVVAGYTESYGAGDTDLWMLKLDTDGAAQWEGTYGGSDNDVANSIQLTGDGGYIVAGYTGAYPYYDAWVLKLDKNGTVQWEKAYSGANVDKILNIQTTSDGGYIAFGYTSSYGAGSFDHLLLKLDAGGAVQWEKTYGTSDPDMGYSIKQTSDGGFIMAGVISTATNGLDFMVHKVDAGGSSQWGKNMVEARGTLLAPSSRQLMADLSWRELPTPMESELMMSGC